MVGLPLSRPFVETSTVGTAVIPKPPGVGVLERKRLRCIEIDVRR